MQFFAQGDAGARPSAGTPVAAELRRLKPVFSTDKTVSQIAYACGFQNQSSFNRIFLKHCGITPSSFRCRQSAPPDEPLL